MGLEGEESEDEVSFIFIRRLVYRRYRELLLRYGGWQ